MSSKTSFRSYSLSYDNNLKFTVVDITFIFSCWFLTVQFAHMTSLCWLFLKIARFRRSQIGKIKSKQWKNVAKISEPVLIMVCAWYKSCIKIIYTKIYKLLISTSIQRVCCISSFLVSRIEKSGRHLKKSLRCYTKCIGEFLSILSSENYALYQHRKWSFSSSNKKPIIAG